MALVEVKLIPAVLRGIKPNTTINKAGLVVINRRESGLCLMTVGYRTSLIRFPSNVCVALVFTTSSQGV